MANGADDAFLFSLLFTLLPLGSRVMCPSLLLLLRQGARSRLALCEGFIQRGAEREEENVKIVPPRPPVSDFFFLSFDHLSSSKKKTHLPPPPSFNKLPTNHPTHFTQPTHTKVKKAIEKGNIDGAKIYAQNAIRKKTEALNYLRLASRLDAVVSRLETQAKMQGVARSMGGIVKALDRALATNNIEKVAETMDAFEKQFEDLDVQSQVMEGAMSAQASLATPEEDVATLLQQVADEHGLEVQLNLPQAGAQVSCRSLFWSCCWGWGGRGGEGGLFFFCLVVVFFVSFFFSDPLSSPSLKKTKNKKQKKTQVAAPPQAAPQSAEPDLSERLAQLRGGAAK